MTTETKNNSSMLVNNTYWAAILIQKKERRNVGMLYTHPSLTLYQCVFVILCVSSWEVECRLKRRKTETAPALHTSSAARTLNTSPVTFYTHSFYGPTSNNTPSPRTHICRRVSTVHAWMWAHSHWMHRRTLVTHTHTHTHTPSGSRPGKQAGSRLDQINMRLVMRPQRRG